MMIHNIAALAIACVAASPTLANTACDYPVPAWAHKTPNVAFTVDYVAARAMSGHCHLGQPPGRFLAGCSLRVSGTTWKLFINAEQSARDRACALVYEKAHLRPNSWEDGAMESTRVQE